MAINSIKHITLAGFIALAVISCNPEMPTTNEASVNPVSIEDYLRAEQNLSANTNKLVLNNMLSQYWQSDDSLVYRKTTEEGSQYMRVDAAGDAAVGSIDTGALAEALAEYSEEILDPSDLALSAVQLIQQSSELNFQFENQRFSYDLQEEILTSLGAIPADEFLSPDGSKAAFIDSHNLWVRDTTSNELSQLTFDGEENYGYATNNAGWIRDEGPVLLWSPDSSKIATFRHDGRNVKEMYLYTTQVGHVELDAWKYPLPGDESIFMIERLVIHLGDSPALVKLNMPADPHRSSISDHVAGSGGRFLDVEWRDDSGALAFVTSSRDHKVAELSVANPFSGEVRKVYREEVETYYESGFNRVNWRVLHDRNEFIWFSEADNWGHLYLRDLTSGDLIRQITSGPWAVLQVQQVDEDSELIYFLASNRESGNPYYQYLYRVHFDGTGLELLTPEPAHHSIRWSESAEYFTDSYSTPVNPAHFLIRSKDGALVGSLEQADNTALKATGWVEPEPFVVKARDQITDLYGLLYKPSHFNPAQAYPILNYLYPGPQSGSVGSRAFRAARNDKQALAELGFIVVEVDAMGTPGRSKSFHDAYYGDMGDNGLPDQVGMIRQLAAQRPWMDLQRVGIWGHSGGGFASTAGILRYPEFYKVAVSGAGNHDNRNYEDDWGEKWQGLLETYPESNPLSGDSSGTTATNYDNQANQLLVANLEGKLLLAHGMMDTNVHPSSTMLVVQALIEEEKDFDLLVLPNAGHGFGNRRYFMKRRWDYFVRHLLGGEPVSEFRFADNIR